MSKNALHLRKTAIAAAVTAGLFIAAPVFSAPATGPGVGMGPGMMAGGEQECEMGSGMMGGHEQGSGMMGGHGQRSGMGSGMMGGHGQGSGKGAGMTGSRGQECDLRLGMMGGHGQGSGMMGGHGPGSGMGSGMMGSHGHGMGAGMMSYSGMPGLNLDDEQRAKANKIQDASRKKMWESMGGMLDASSKLRDLLSAPARDRAAISAAHKQVTELRRQMFEIRLDAEDEFERILSADQRKLLRR